jgi:hypothetical protein
MHTSPTKFTRKRPQNHHKKIAKKGSKNHQKEKMGETTKGLEEPHRIFYTYQKRFIQGLACLPIIDPSLKISP